MGAKLETIVKPGVVRETVFVPAVLMSLCLFVCLSLWSTHCFATDPCVEYRNTMPQPSWFQETCNKSGGHGTAKIGGGYSSYADPINLNPASIPTKPTPMGVEVIYSFSQAALVTGKTNLALIKGFQKFGTGISLSSDNTFFSNQPVSVAQNTSTGASSTQFSPGSTFSSAGSSSSTVSSPVLNLGSAIDLDILKRDMKGYNGALGGLAKIATATNKITPGFGFSIQKEFFSLGGSYFQEKDSLTNQVTASYTYSFGIRLNSFMAEYLLMSTTGAQMLSQPIHLLTASYSASRFMFSFAVKRAYDLSNLSTIEYHGAAKLTLTSMLAAGYLYNYIKGCHSVGAQILF